MSFSEVLECYITQFGCTAKDICEKSGISAAALSRYRSGERIPNVTSEVFAKLCMALVEIANENGITEITESSIRESFLSATESGSVDEKQLMQNFEKLISVLSFNINRLCRYINYDVSTVFRFRNGTRKLADPEKFASAVAGYITREFDDAQTKSVLAELLVCDVNSLSDSSVRFERLTEWLLSGKSEKDNTISDFLNKLDEFNLNEYIKAIHFDELKVPTVPFQRSLSKTYFGLDEMMKSELDFLKATVLSKSMDPVIMYSDMPMGDMAKDPEFPKKWMFGMAMMLKKGLHLNIIHNIDRSFEEMMLGLESYIPMYMTGQISPFYLKNTQNNVFLHFLKVSGSAALSGEAIAGHHSQGKYYLTKSKKELEYYSKRANDLLSCASPLINRKTRNERPVDPYNWQNTTVKHILDNPQYTGCTVNGRSSIVSYKVHKKIEYDESEWQIIPNTQEAIIDEKIFKTVHEMRASRRRNTATGRTSLFSNLVFCGDCGSKMYFCAAKSINENQEFFRCSAYKENRGTCTIHFIRNVVLEEMVLETVRKTAKYISENETVFLYLYEKNHRLSVAKELRDTKLRVEQAKKRIKELDGLISASFEQLARGTISEERFKIFCDKYEAEQKELTKFVSETETEIQTAKQDVVDLKAFLENIRECTDIQKLTPTLVNTLIKKIEIFNSVKGEDGKKHVPITIHFRSVDIVTVPDEEEIIAAMEEIRNNPTKVA